MKKSILIILTIVVLGFVGLYYSQSKHAFESDKWKEWVESEENLNMRWQMIDSLTFKHNLIGLNKAEIKSLLGDPTTENTNSWSYNLGPTGMGINYGSLRIEFNETIVTQYKVLEH